jgi:hypothetical protein
MSRFFENPTNFERLEQGMKGSEQVETASLVETLRAACEGDSLLQDLFEAWLSSAERYTENVIEFQLAIERDDQDELDRFSRVRQRIHDGFISNTDVLARNMQARGKDGSWNTALGSDRSFYAVLAIKTAYHELKASLSKTKKETP